MRVTGPSNLNVSCYYKLTPGRCHLSCIRIVFGVHPISFGHGDSTIRNVGGAGGDSEK